VSDALAYLRARLEAQKAKRVGAIPFCPQIPEPKQRHFMSLMNREALYGGAAGGMKSSTLLMCALMYVDRPHYRALLIRKTLKDLTLPGALLDRMKSWLLPRGDVRWVDDEKKFIFPSGAEIVFGYCETDNDIYRYQGSELHFCGFDELTQFSDMPYRYILGSRMRKAKGDDIPIRMRAASNPGGKGHKWVKERFVFPGHQDRPFVPSLITDNPHVDAEDYLEFMKELDETTRAQLRDGIWVDDGAGLVYRYDRTRNAIHELPALDGWHAVLSVDLGSSEIKPSTAFAITLWHPHHTRAVVVRAWAEAGMIPSTIAERIREVLELYPDARVVMDIGALGSGYANELRQRWAIPVEAAEKSQKLGFRKLLNGALERGEVVLFAPECAMLIEELESLIWAPSGLDNDKTQPNHCTDALLYGWRASQSWRAAFHKSGPQLTEEQAWEKRAKERHRARNSDPLANW
jgi:hypothetical protein